MMKQKIKEFKGIYTNASEVNITLEYCKETNAKLTTKGLIAKQDTIDINNPLFNFGNQEILYFDYIGLDNDRQGIEYDSDEAKYKSNYIYNVDYYYIVVIAEYIYLYDVNSLRKIETDSPIKYAGNFVKGIKYDNKFYLFTTEKSYELAKYNRTTNRANSKGTFYQEVGIYLKPITYKRTNSLMNSVRSSLGNYINVNSNELAVNLSLERIGQTSNNLILEYNVKLILYKTIGDSSFPIVYVIGLWDTDYNIMRGEAWFTRLRGKSPSLHNDYSLMVFGTNEKNYTSFVSDETLQLFPKYDNPSSWFITFTGYQSPEINSFKGKRWSLQDLENLIGVKETFKQKVIVDENNGFSSLSFEVNYIASYLLDDGSEIPILKDKLEINTVDDLFVYKLNAVFPYNLSTKVTAFRLYIKHKEEESYEVLCHYSFYDDNILKTILTKNDLQGIYITQTIGFEEPFEEKEIIAFDDANFVEGVLFALVGNNVYYPVVGNGYITKVYNTYNVIPKVYGQELFNINGQLAIASNDRIQIVHVVNQSGVLLFNLKDELGMTTDDQYDVVETPDGLILNTSKGIYVTNGQGLEMISTQINDIVKSNFGKSNIFYNYFDKELYYCTEDKIYKFYFELNAWGMTDYFKFDKLVVDKMNTKYVFEGSKVYRMNEINKDCIYESLLTNLGYMGLLKVLTHIDFDFEGEIVFNNKIINSKNRSTKTIYYQIKDRKYKDYENWEFELKSGTILYGIEINFEIIKKINQYTE